MDGAQQADPPGEPTIAHASMAHLVKQNEPQFGRISTKCAIRDQEHGAYQSHQGRAKAGWGSSDDGRENQATLAPALLCQLAHVTLLDALAAPD
jgi:hypothetical protein